MKREVRFNGTMLWVIDEHVDGTSSARAFFRESTGAWHPPLPGDLTPSRPNVQRSASITTASRPAWLLGDLRPSEAWRLA